MIVENRELIIHIEKALMMAKNNDDKKDNTTMGQYGLIYLRTFIYIFTVEKGYLLAVLLYKVIEKNQLWLNLWKVYDMNLRKYQY